MHRIWTRFHVHSITSLTFSSILILILDHKDSIHRTVWSFCFLHITLNQDWHYSTQQFGLDWDYSTNCTFPMFVWKCSNHRLNWICGFWLLSIPLHYTNAHIFPLGWIWDHYYWLCMECSWLWIPSWIQSSL